MNKVNNIYKSSSSLLYIKEINAGLMYINISYETKKIELKPYYNIPSSFINGWIFLTDIFNE